MLTLEHNSCKCTAENFDRHVSLCQNYSRQELYQRSLAVAAFASGRAWYVEMIAGQFHRIEDISSIGFTFRISETLMIFRGWQRLESRLRLSPKHSTPWWTFCKDRIVGVSRSWFSRTRRPKRDWGQTRSSSVVLRDSISFISARPSSPLSNIFFISSLEIGSYGL